MTFSAENSHPSSAGAVPPPRVVRKRPVRPSAAAFTGSATESTNRENSSAGNVPDSLGGKVHGGDAEQKISSTVDTGDAPAPTDALPLADPEQTEENAADFLDKLLETLVYFKGSDLHLKTGVPPRIRVDGDLHALDLGDLSAEQLHAMIVHITPEKLHQKYVDEHREADFSYTSPLGARFRVNAFYQRGTPSIVFRFVAVVPPTLEALNMPDVIGALADNHRGLILVTGPTGSGKTTTLAAMLDRINGSRPATIVTIEDPIEVMHTDRECLIQQREIGLDTEDFHTALRSVLRQDPDVILVGEMRDTETVRAALAAAETGHLVLSTLHTLNAQETVNRIIDFFPPHERKQMRLTLAGTLNGIICQRLVQKQEGGRTAVMEIMVNTGRISEAIADEEETKNLTKIISESEYDGMVTFDQNLVDLFRKNVIGYEDMLNASSNPHNIRAYLKKVGLLPPNAQ